MTLKEYARVALNKFYVILVGIWISLFINNTLASTLVWDQSLWTTTNWSKPVFVTVTRGGTGLGAVRFNNGNCTGTCQYLVDSGQLLNVSVSVTQNHFFNGFSPNICGNRSACQFRIDDSLAIIGEFVALSTSSPEAVDVPVNENAQVRSISEFSAIRITGIDGPVVASISYGEFSVNCTGNYTSLPTLIQPGDTICVRHQVRPGETSSVLTVGSTEYVFITTAAKLAKRKRLILKLIPILQP
ncbi:hypothetical protein [Alishewanella longhuensis]